MVFQPGDRVIAESESTRRAAPAPARSARFSATTPARYRIEWDDGHESTTRLRQAHFTPSSNPPAQRRGISSAYEISGKPTCG